MLKRLFASHALASAVGWKPARHELTTHRPLSQATSATLGRDVQSWPATLPLKGTMQPPPLRIDEGEGGGGFNFCFCDVAMKAEERRRTGLDVGRRVDALEAASEGSDRACDEVRDRASRERLAAGKARALLDRPLALGNSAGWADGRLVAQVGAADEARAAG